MRLLGVLTALVALGALRPAGAEQGEELLALRVLSSGPGSVATIDRGLRDRLAVGDPVLFFPRGGGTCSGVVIQLEERRARVELNDPAFRPEPGTKGELRLPKSRFPEPALPVGPDAGATEGEKERWKNKDENYTPGQPLLAGLKPVRPEERRKRLSGRIYTIAALTSNPDGDYGNSHLRVGADLEYQNPFGKGGGLRFGGEIAYLTRLFYSDAEIDLLIRRLSYYSGGTRFDASRWELGRFLQTGMPEFGVLDGFSWGRRTLRGDRFGVSIGFMPVPDQDFRSFRDFQVAGFYEWVRDPRERLRFSLGFQKTWHDGAPDRDLALFRFSVLPDTAGDGWDFRGSFWIDFYTGGDPLKSGVELTYMLVSATRRWSNGNGIELVVRHQRIPDLRRGEVTPPVVPAELAGNNYSRVEFNAWALGGRHLRMDFRVGGWDDQDQNGGSAELGFDVTDYFGAASTLRLTGFGALAQFENIAGVRASYGQRRATAYWEVLYEFSNRRQLGLPGDRNDIFHHRVRAGGGTSLDGGWDFSLYAEGLLYDEEISWSLGFTFQRRF